MTADPVIIVDNGGEYSSHTIHFLRSGPQIVMDLVSLSNAVSGEPKMWIMAVVTEGEWTNAPSGSLEDMWDSIWFDEDDHDRMSAAVALMGEERFEALADAVNAWQLDEWRSERRKRGLPNSR